MTVAELMDLLVRWPDHYKVKAFDGWGLVGDAKIADWVDVDQEEIWITS